MQFDFDTHLVPFLWRLGTAVTVVVVGVIAIRLLTTLTRRGTERWIRDTTVRSYVLNTFRVLLWGFLIVTVLNVAGVETASLVAILGAAGLAIGLALQGSLSNLAAGIMLLIFRPFRSGEEVEIQGVTGRVVEIAIFSTVVDLPEGVRAFVPNSLVFNNVIRNRSVLGYRRPQVKVQLSPGSDYAAAAAIALQAVGQLPDQLPAPEPSVTILEEGSAGLTIAIRATSLPDREDALRGAMLPAIRERLRAAGIEPTG